MWIPLSWSTNDGEEKKIAEFLGFIIVPRACSVPLELSKELLREVKAKQLFLNLTSVTLRCKTLLLAADKNTLCYREGPAEEGSGYPSSAPTPFTNSLEKSEWISFSVTICVLVFGFHRAL
jgi:hypothetical protein